MSKSKQEIRYGSVRYEKVEQDYLEKRKLRKSANWLLLWALGVGAVISGDYFGWNFGLAVGGFGGLFVATMVIAVMYVCMVYCIAELSTALPHAGGFYSFTRSAFGPWAGYLVGITDTIEYVITPAVIVLGIGGYLNTLLPIIPNYFWWILAYTLFVGINIRGVELTLKVGLLVTLLAMAVFGAVISYAMVMFSYIILKRTHPNLSRPYKSPLGTTGAYVGVFLFLISLVATFAVQDYRPGVIGVAIYLVFAILYFALCSSKRLVAQAPEEEVALIEEAEKELRHR